MGLFGAIFGGGTKLQPTSVRTVEQFRAEVLGSELPVIVDVWSDTCPPCRKLWPVMVQIATKYQGRVKVAEINTYAEPALLASLGVMATPTVIIFDQGEEYGRTTGFRPPSWFEEMIEAEFPEEG
ncbi:MAG: thioredoxin family protein [Deltaproteobacteria bacterium]|nr:thioredoxin family protein [Deltaproteobacteria bacterium]